MTAQWHPCWWRRCRARQTVRARRGERDRVLLHFAAGPWLDLDLRKTPCAEEHKDGGEHSQHNEVRELAVEGDAQKRGSQAVDSIRERIDSGGDSQRQLL